MRTWRSKSINQSCHYFAGKVITKRIYVNDIGIKMPCICKRFMDQKYKDD